MPLLSMQGICKSFPGVRALADVDFAVEAGEIHALMGENGAGKSTLIKVLTGVYTRDAGRVEFAGRPIRPRSPREAEACGISTVYQEINLVPELSVAENICLGRQPTRLGFIRWGQLRRQAEAALARLDLHIDVRRNLSSYSTAVQQLVAIARALDTQARLLVLDEPTSSLDEKEAQELFAIMRRLRQQGMAMIFVTHFLDQVYQVSDRITVLRDGALVGQFAARDLSRLELVAKMIGKDPAAVRELECRHPAPTEGGQAFVEVRGLARSGSVGPLDFEVPARRVVGLAGLLGSGRTETARLLFGVDRADAGTISVDGQTRSVRSPRQAIRCGFAFTSEDRKLSGIVPELSVTENITLALQARRNWLRRISATAAQAVAERFIAALRIKTPHAGEAMRNLSGGNQQKALLARWLAVEPRLLILDEPTRGIDVGAKADIEALTAELCADGMSVLFISSELEEVVRVSHHLVILRDRHKVGELHGEQIDLSQVIHRIAEPHHE